MIRRVSQSGVPFLFNITFMINKQSLCDCIAPVLEEKGCFLVECKISRDNDITISLDKLDGEVDLVICVAVSHYIEEHFDREAEDYSLTVASAGLDQPLLVLEQFKKYVGQKVEIALKGGRRFVALLNSYSESGVNVTYDTLQAVEGSKKKQRVTLTEDLSFNDINYVKPYIEF